MGPRVKVSLIRCGRCGKPRGLVHVCVIRMGRRPGKTSFRPRVTRDCPKCKRPVTNPLTHVCKVKTDFRRKAAAARKQRAAGKRRQASSVAKVGRARAKARAKAKSPPKPRHDYHSCHDLDCARVACVAYRDGEEYGHAEGFDEGYAAGQSAR